MAKQKMNTEQLVKKLKSVSNTQDSIPMLSLWIIHHKSHHKLIVDQWLQVLKHSKSPHRLTLLYLCNDVIQNCHRKNADIFKDTFCDVLPEAITLLRDSLIRPNVERVVKIWSKRKVLDSEITDQLIAALLTNKPPQKLRNKLLVEYKTSHLINEIKKFKDLEDEIEAEQQRLRAMRVDVSNYDAIRRLKDKIGGEKFSKDFEESASQVELFLKRYDKFVEKRKQLLELLDQGSVYYHAQYHEAQIVVNAYKNFEGRVNKMKRGLDKVKSTLPPAITSSHNNNEAFQMQAKQPDGQEDMEMSDDDMEMGSKPSKIVAINTSFLKPVQKTSQEKLSETEQLNNATENMLKLLATGLDPTKSSSELVGDPIKKVGSGLIKRPGMRGASDLKTTSTTVKKEIPIGSLTITRSIEQADNDFLRLDLPNDIDVTLGSESPPSPTGSPELNISSPPRHQSLDSRLADLFNNATPGETDKPISDSESDVGEIPKDPETKPQIPQTSTSLLPGLGGLTEITSSIPGLNATPSETVSIIAPINTTQSTVEGNSSHAIPVIGGSLRALTSTTQDGSSTPTLDETPYTAQSNLSASSNFTGMPAFLSPPRFSGGDPLSFLSKFMDQATNSNLPLNESITTEQTSKPNTENHVWPHTEKANPVSTSIPWITSDSVTLPTEPSIPVPPSWDSFNKSVAKMTQPFPASSIANSESINTSVPLLKHEHPDDLHEETPTKKGRWADSTHEDTKYGKEPLNRQDSFHAKIDGRRNSNLITLSGQSADQKPVTTPTEPVSTSAYEPMAHFRDILRRKSAEHPSAAPQTQIATEHVKKEPPEPKTESESDESVMHLSTQAVITGHRKELRDFKNTQDTMPENDPHSSSVYVASDSQDEAFEMEREVPYSNAEFLPPLSHHQEYHEAELHRNNGIMASPMRGPPPGRVPVYPREPHPVGPQIIRRRSYREEDLLDYELGLIQEERRRDAAMMDSILSHERRLIRPVRHPLRPRMRLRHPGPAPPPRFMGHPRPPRMRYY
uniref:Regulation of nuclear pre-mRNA domain-containing protein 2 n=1 Tax=Phallusia mammillata TaxID=59560 RepID=A0A6F9DQM2_9ASCI|nr:regulation of nuclear pre-mRNA domain-containing protein 2-like [Phallusia mammillata]